MEHTSSKTAVDLAERYHPSCIACGARNCDGLGLRFIENADGSVEVAFDCHARYQGYPDRLHGGAVAMLADAAMTHCLFVRGISAVTAKLSVKFRNPVEVRVPATVRARLIRETHSLFVLQAEILQDGVVKAEAEGLFFEQEPRDKDRNT